MNALSALHLNIRKVIHHPLTPQPSESRTELLKAKGFFICSGAPIAAVLCIVGAEKKVAEKVEDWVG